MKSAVPSALDRARPRSSLAEEAERLIHAYPHVTNEEVDRLVEIFPKLPILDVGLMTSDESLGLKLEAFHKEHGSRIRTPLPHLFLLLAGPTIFILITLWATFAL